MSKMSYASAMGWWATRDPEAPAVTCAGITISRGELDRMSNRLARAYLQLGVRNGDFVVLSLPNSIEIVASAVAALKVGATVLPISADFSVEDRDRIVSLAKPALVVGAGGPVAGAWATVPAGFEPSETVSAEPLPDATAHPWFATTSSGSSGTPKLIINTDSGVLDPEVPALYLSVDRAVLIPSPMYHGGPFNIGIRSLCWGNHLVLMPRFEAQEALELLARHRIDYFPAVPTMATRILRLGVEAIRKFDLSALRVLVTMAAACPAWLKDAWIELLGPERVHEFYSCTEQLGLTWITGLEWLEHRGSVGRSLTGGQIRIIDEQGQEAPTRTIGEIFMMPAGGPGSSYRYVGAEGRRRPDGWETTGDLGWLDEDGFLYIADRRTDMIVTGGANVFPAEVEAVLDAFPGVRASAVIGLPDDDLGHRVHAVVEAEASVTEGALRAWATVRLLRYKVPRTFEFSQTPVRNEAGKVSRSKLRQARMASAENR